MIAIRVGKTKWVSAISDWLVSQLEFGKYGFNRDTLEPDYPYFEYWFVNAEDAAAFVLTFREANAAEWTLWET